jgi:hypothetical protein
MKMTATEMFVAHDFATKIVGNIDQKDFMDGRNARRSSSKVHEDNVKGKLAEMFIMNKLGEVDVLTTLDLNIYELGKGDDFDIVANDKSIDVKASSPRARNLLVELDKFKSWRTNAPNYLCMVAVDGDTVEYLFGTTFTNFCANAILIKRGELLPNTRTALKASNLVINVNQCSTNVDDLTDYMEK